MGSKMQETGRTSTKTEIPGFAQGYINQVSSAAQQAFQNPYEAYGGQRVAEFSPDTQSYFGAARDIAGSGIQGLPTAQGATAMGMGQAFNIAGQNLTGGQMWPGAAQDAYMSPYMQNVVGRQQSEAQRQFDIGQAGRAQAAVRAGAFGGSRQAVAQNLAEETLRRQQGDIAAQGYQSAYENAQSQFNADQARRIQSQGLGLQGIGQGLQGAQQLAALGEAQRAADIQGAGMLADIGATQEARSQAELDTAYQDWQQQQQYPWQQMQNYTGIMSGLYGSVPMNQTSSEMSRQPGLARQILGTGIGLAGTLGGAMLGAPAGSLGAGLGQAATGWIGSRMGGVPAASPVARPLMYNLGAQYGGGLGK